jgi:hypothetical protein
MGKDARISVVKKRSEQELHDDMLKLAQDQLGPLLRHGAYGRCPKCPADGKALQYRWCPGFIDGLPQNTCEIMGEHLHGECAGCGFRWREEIRLVDDCPAAAKRA